MPARCARDSPLHAPLAILQAAQIQQGRTEVRRCQEQIAAQHLALQGLAAERDACRHSAQEASQQVKVSAAVLHLPLSDATALVQQLSCAADGC